MTRESQTLSDFLFDGVRLAESPRVGAILWMRRADGGLDRIQIGASNGCFDYWKSVEGLAEVTEAIQMPSAPYLLAVGAGEAGEGDEYQGVIYRVGPPGTRIGVLMLQGLQGAHLGEGDVGAGGFLADLIAYATCVDHDPEVIRKLIPRIGPELKRIRRLRNSSVESVGKAAGLPVDDLKSWEAGQPGPTDAQLYAWLTSLKLAVGGAPARFESIEVSPELLAYLKQDPARMHILSPETFETLIADLVERTGYTVTLTGETSARDGGIDFIGRPKRPSLGACLIAGQVKHHRPGIKVGREAVDRLLAWRDTFRLAYLVTNTDFTRDASWVAGRFPHSEYIRLRGFQSVTNWILGQFFSPEEARELPDQIELAPGVKVELRR